MRLFQVTYESGYKVKGKPLATIIGFATGPSWYLVRLRATALYGDRLRRVSPELTTTTLPGGKLLFEVEG